LLKLQLMKLQGLLICWQNKALKCTMLSIKTT
jgi:hypothetical protein